MTDTWDIPPPPARADCVSRGGTGGGQRGLGLRACPSLCPCAHGTSPWRQCRRLLITSLRCPLVSLVLPAVATACSNQQIRQTCVRKSLICAFAIAFIISVMLIAANQVLRSGMK